MSVAQDRRLVVADTKEPDRAGKFELQQQFIEYRAKGWSYARIARRLKLAKSTLSNWASEFEEEIASLKAMELEALYERYFLAKEGRIKLLGEQIKAIQKEIKSRDLSEVPTEKLLELQLRYFDQLLDEFVEVRPLSDEEMARLKALG